MSNLFCLVKVIHPCGIFQKGFFLLRQVHLFTWHEADPLMDGNFSMSDKIVLVGFINGQLVGKVQSGLPVIEEAAPLPTEEAAG